MIAKHRTVVAYIVDRCLCIPQHCTLDVRQLVMELSFGSHLMVIGIVGIGMVHRSLHILADIQRTIGRVVVPPDDEFLVVSRLVTYLPV